MKDIKTLYVAAKSSGSAKDINAYVEHINNLNPNDYILHLEYIIKSNIGLQTLKPFVEKYGLSLPLCDHLINEVTNCIEAHKKGRVANTIMNEYTNTLSFLKEYKDTHIKAYDMYEFYSNEDDIKSYLKDYYSINKNGIQGNKLISGMLKKYHEMAIPDLIITAKNINENAVNTLFEMINNSEEIDANGLFIEFYNEACMNENINPDIAELVPSNIIQKMHERHQMNYNESVINNNSDIVCEYTYDEITALRDLISYKEYALLNIKDEKLFAEAYDELSLLIEEAEENKPDDIPDKDDLNEDDYVPIFGILKNYDAKKSEGVSVAVKKLVNVTFGDVYSHAVCSLDIDMKELWSFESEGIFKDSFENENWYTTESIYFTVMFITKDEMKKIKKNVDDLAKIGDKMKYDYANFLKMFVLKDGGKVDKRFICSGYVAYLLRGNDFKNLQRDYSRLRPEEITILPRAFYVGNYVDANDWKQHKDEFKAKVKAIKNAHIDEIMDYNNYLPRILMKDTMKKLSLVDKVQDKFMDKNKKEGES